MCGLGVSRVRTYNNILILLYVVGHSKTSVVTRKQAYRFVEHFDSYLIDHVLHDGNWSDVRLLPHGHVFIFYIILIKKRNSNANRTKLQ